MSPPHSADPFFRLRLSFNFTVSSAKCTICNYTVWLSGIHRVCHEPVRFLQVMRAVLTERGWLRGDTAHFENTALIFTAVKQ